MHTKPIRSTATAMGPWYRQTTCPLTAGSLYPRVVRSGQDRFPAPQSAKVAAHVGTLVGRRAKKLPYSTPPGCTDHRRHTVCCPTRLLRSNRPTIAPGYPSSARSNVSTCNDRGIRREASVAVGHLHRRTGRTEGIVPEVSEDRESFTKSAGEPAYRGESCSRTTHASQIRSVVKPGIAHPAGGRYARRSGRR